MAGAKAKKKAGAGKKLKRGARKPALARKPAARKPAAVRQVHGPEQSRRAAGRGTDPARVAKLLEGLDGAYPAATCALGHRNAFELLVATILSAQCTDERVNQVTPGLFQKYPTPGELAIADPRELEQEIRSTGFYHNKAKSLLGASRRIVEVFGGEVPQTMEQLLTLAGVARKTANVVLGTAFGIPSGVVVDTHVQRIAQRLDLTRNTDPKKIEQDLMKVVPQDRWILFSHQVIWHGRRVCQARRPKCAECVLEKVCYSKDKTYSSW